MVYIKTWFILFLSCNAALSQVLFGDDTPVSFDESPQNDNDVNIQNILGIKETDVQVQTRFSFGNPKPKKGETCTDPRGKPGTCQYIFERPCRRILRAVRRLGITPSVLDFLRAAIKSPCGFEDFDFTLCCHDPRQSPPTTQRPTTQRPTEAPTPSCGISESATNNRIIGGQEVTSAQKWPWATILGIPNGNRIRVMCGGTLINDRYVLTAAHCFDGSSPTHVRLGELDIASFDNRHQDIRIGSKIIHPNWSRRTLKNDIALVRMTSTPRAALNKPVCLPYSYVNVRPENLREGGVVIGWGAIDNHDKATVDTLREAILPIESVSSCNAKYSNTNVNIGNDQLCAGLGDKDTCQGDSGGPMLSLERDGSKWSIIGITSFGVDCADTRFPGVYTRVDKYLDWIEQNTK